ncbi:MAG: Asp-tRNA(Asn)/Glu-tRNA(Gln) amidotransferase GatCAB subunit A, partial [Eggerthellaceae bacterium]|nr:Asp-tRNA(Asn)/Glu-tRNA(Gln) amidotransferase GatCAB subunit A [Eggerthellaceae bacterium]
MPLSSLAQKLGGWRASDIRDAYLSGRVSAKEIVDAAYERIEYFDKDVHAFLELTKDKAYEAASRIDEALKNHTFEKMGILAGIPFGIKDNMNMEGSHTTCSSVMLKDYVSPYTATCVKRMLDAGAIPLGKLNMDEFAFGSSTETSAFGPTNNPWDLQRVPGGSSGGSAAAIAAGLACITLGSDTGGSIRQPGAFCGCVAVKPTYGVVSRYGVVAFGSSLDQVGPFARSVEDAALALNALSGHDELDCTS